MNGIPRILAEPWKTIDAGEARAIGTTIMNINGRDFLANDAHHLLAGTLERASGKVIILQLARNPAGMPRGMALIYQLNVEEARELAGDFIKLADDLEAAAADQAVAAIERAGKRRASPWWRFRRRRGLL